MCISKDGERNSSKPHLLLQICENNILTAACCRRSVGKRDKIMSTDSVGLFPSHLCCIILPFLQRVILVKKTPFLNTNAEK